MLEMFLKQVTELFSLSLTFSNDKVILSFCSLCAEISSFRLFDKRNLNSYQLHLEVTITIIILAKWNLCLNLIAGNSQAGKYARAGHFKIFIRRYHVQSENKAFLDSCSTHSYKTPTMHPLVCCAFLPTCFFFGSQNTIW